VDRSSRRAKPDEFSPAQPTAILRSWSDPVGTIKANLLGTLYLLGRCEEANLACQVLVFGSSADTEIRLRRTESIPETAAMSRQSLWRKQKFGGFVIRRYIPAHMARILSACAVFVDWGPGRGSNVFVTFAKRHFEVDEGGARRSMVSVTCLQSGISSTSGMPFARSWTIAGRVTRGSLTTVYRSRPTAFLPKSLDIMLNVRFSTSFEWHIP